MLPEERWFQPSRGDVEAVEGLFADRSGRGIFIAARASEPRQCPHTALPEVGRELTDSLPSLVDTYIVLTYIVI